MRIAINARYLTAPYSGIGQYTINLLKSLAEIDQQNEYILFTPWPVDFSFGPNFKIIDIREGKLFENDYMSRAWWEQVSLSRAIKKYKPDLFHSTYQTLPLQANKLPSIVTIHDAIPWKFEWQQSNRLYRWYSNLSRWSCGKLTLGFCISEAAKLDVAFIYKIKPEKLLVTYQGVADRYYEAPLPTRLKEIKQKFGLERPFILYVGGFKRHKNLRVLIKAFAQATRKFGLDIDLVIPGKMRQHSGFTKELFYDPNSLKAYVKAKHVASRVRFIGYADFNELACLYRLSHVFITLSLYEGFGLPVLEAMVSGKPVIASHVGAHPEVVGDAGVLVYPYGLTRITDAIGEMFLNQKKYKEYKDHGAKQIEKFDKKKIAKLVVEYYEAVYEANK